MILLVAIYLAFELLTYIYYLYVCHIVNKKQYHASNITQMTDSATKAEQYILEVITRDELTKWIQRSFLFRDSTNIVPLPQIPKEKMIKWVAYFLFFQSLWQLTQEQVIRALSVLDKIEHRIEFVFGDFVSDEKENNIYFLKYGTNPIDSRYRPLLISAGISLIKWYCYFILVSGYGFTKRTMVTGTGTSMVYFLYSNPNHTSTTVFLHGFGFGIYPYMSFLKQLGKTTNVIVPVFPNVSNMEYHTKFEPLRNNDLFPSFTQLRDSFHSLIEEHGSNTEVNMIGHSFGTIVMSGILKDSRIRSLINKTVYVEPVCFIDRYYKVGRYMRSALLSNTKASSMTKVVNRLIYSDIYVQYVTNRYLYGPEYLMFDYGPSDMSNSLVIVSENDQIVPSDAIVERCKESDNSYMYVNDATHADIFLDKKYEHVLTYIRNFL